MEETEEQVFKVAQVISDFKLVINKGSNFGVRAGQRVLVYSVGQESIVDPDTNEVLGNLEIVKGTGVVTHVQDRIATVESDRKSKSFRKIIRNPGGSLGLGGLANLLGQEEIIDPAETIPFDNPEIGDLVKFL